MHWFHLKHALDATEPSKSWHHNWGGPCDGSLSFPDLGVAPCEQLIANRLSLYQDGGCLTPLTLSAFVAIATVHYMYMRGVCSQTTAPHLSYCVRTIILNAHGI